MGITTLLRYLIGDRQAILDIAASRKALWVGLLFVISAGFAREYDGEDLQREPWHVLIPLAASVVSSFLLFVVTFWRVIDTDPQRPGFLSAYRSFLTLFWMTAPLAWLYAIPYERFLSPYEAVSANLWTLGLVAVWRVALMVRVVSVLMGYRVLSAFFLVMLFADAVTFLAAWLTPRPVFAIMGGVRLTESELLIRGLTHCLMGLGVCSFPVWFFGAILCAAKDRPAWQVPPDARDGDATPTSALWGPAAASVMFWPLVLPWTQPEQVLRGQVERDLRAGRIAEALVTMSDHPQSDFPPHWDPPPRVGYGESAPPIIDVVEAMLDPPAADWVQAIYVEKLRQYLGDRYFMYHLRGGEARRILNLTPRLPDGPALIEEYGRFLEERAEADVGPQQKQEVNHRVTESTEKTKPKD
jgi:hypothetical protein